MLPNSDRWISSVESDDVGRRDLLKFAGATAAAGLTGCLGDNGDSDSGDGAAPVSNGQGSGSEYSELADEYGLTDSGEQVLEEHCNLPSDTRKKANEWTDIISGDPIEQASFREEEGRYIMRLTHYDGPVTDEREVTMNGDVVSSTEDPWPDSYAVGSSV